MTILLRFSQRAHGDVVFFEPAGDSVGITPFVLFVAISPGNFNRAQLLFDVFLRQPFLILIKSFSS